MSHLSKLFVIIVDVAPDNIVGQEMKAMAE